jgi:hypothetical protein
VRASGFTADWLLPLVPAVVGAFAHQIGGAYERLDTTTTSARGDRGADRAGTDRSAVKATDPLRG